MKCPRCQHENRSTAKFCEECACPLSRFLLPRAALRAHRVDHGRARQKRRPPRAREIVATLIVVLVGAGIITGIIAGSPRWHTIIASWREGSAAWFAKVSPDVAALGQSAKNSSVGTTSLARVQPLPARPDALALEAAAVSQGTMTHLSARHRARSGAISLNSVQSQDSTRLVVKPPTSSQPDLQIMVNLLVAQLGPGPAWRTALTNADAHAPDSPEFDYWHRVAAAIRTVSAPRR